MVFAAHYESSEGKVKWNRSGQAASRTTAERGSSWRHNITRFLRAALTCIQPNQTLLSR
jgi:hypothetical protein